MARTKEFDPDAALDAALEVFWERGYEATSVADLTERLGIARASLYGTFGDKRELYLKALDRYTETGIAQLVRELSEPGPVLPAIRAVIHRYVDEALGDKGCQGCFAVNVAAGLAPDDELAARRVRDSWRAMELAFASALARAQAQGELARERDPFALARFLFTLTQGIKLIGRADPDEARIRAAAEQALAVLD